jgi:glycosyltransferase involved in cell wall biosynthesis
MSLTKTNSAIAVLMPAHNADRTIVQAVHSVLASRVPCDLYIVDDCSAVPVARIIDPRPRLKIIRLNRNRGVAAALNIGLHTIPRHRYRYIARMDADDISHPERFAAQMAFLDQHPESGLVGCGARWFDDATGSTLMNYLPPTEPTEIRKALFLNSAVLHPTWMLRTEILAQFGFYSGEYPRAEDYEFLRRISRSVSLANLPDILLDYRVSSTSVSVANRHRQLFDRLAIQLRYFELFDWRAWAGALKTLALFFMPAKLVVALKREISRRRAASASFAGSAGT